MRGDFYPETRESGLPWLRSIPAHWSVRRAKFLFRGIDFRSETGTEDLLTVSSMHGVVPRASASVTMFRAESYVGHKLCWPGDLVINSLWAWGGGLGVARQHGIVSTAYGVYRLRPQFEQWSGYFHDLLRSRPFQWELQVRSKGIWISRLQLTDEAFLDAPLPVPPPQDRDAIVRFLDRADRQIRCAIRAKQRLIALLNEQKRAVIHRAVTRGLDTNVRLKPSGVDWLGDVPEHWDVRTLGQVAESFRTGPFGSALHQSDYVEGGIPVINPTHMRDGRVVEDPSRTVTPDTASRVSEYQVQKGDLVFARRGELGRCALVREREEGWLCGTGSIRVRPRYTGIDPEYLIQALQLQSVGEYLSLSSVGATMANLNTGILSGLPLVLPPYPEQKHLLAQVKNSTESIERAVAAGAAEIDLLREYRTRLIADVVTGHLDVRDAAAQLPDEVDEPQQLDEIDVEEFEVSPDEELEAVET